MARGFHTTLGSGTTDAVTTACTMNASLYTVYATLNTRAIPVGISTRIYSQADLGTATDNLLFHNGAGDNRLFIARSNGRWHDNGTTGTGLKRVAFSLDASTTGTTPVMYRDGASVTLVTTTALSVTPTDSGSAWVIGNNSAGTRPFDGTIAEFAVWDVILTAAEMIVLTKGFCPLFIRPQSLFEYVPMVRENVSRILAAPTITGTAVQPHPTVIMPSHPMIGHNSSGVANSIGPLIGGSLVNNSKVLGGRLVA